LDETIRGVRDDPVGSGVDGAFHRSRLVDGPHEARHAQFVHAAEEIGIGAEALGIDLVDPLGEVDQLVRAGSTDHTDGISGASEWKRRTKAQFADCTTSMPAAKARWR